MRLRQIIFLLSLVAFLSSSTGGYIYYSTLKKTKFKEAERQASIRIQTIERNLSSFLSENIRPVVTLSSMPVIAQFLLKREASLEARANVLLDHFNATLGTDVCYLMDADGVTIASSNRMAPDSFMGKDFSFRPYFMRAINGDDTTYLALGTTSRKRGAYYSHPVYAAYGMPPSGVVVIKASVEQVEKNLITGTDEIILLADPQGIIFISSRRAWLYHTLHRISPDEETAIRTSRQFGQPPWPWSGLRFNADSSAVDEDKNDYLVLKSEIENFPGWRIFYLFDQEAILKKASVPLIRAYGLVVLCLCALIGASVFLLYHTASREISRRKQTENALRVSEERYRSIYNNAPAMLHSINQRGELVSVSDHWLKALDYQRNEVIGRRLTCFLSKPSAKVLENTILPEFLETGYIGDIPYRFVKKDGSEIDTLLSAYGERDENGQVVRSLAVSIDVTERIRAEEALREAKDELSRHSRCLEREVKERTSEITSILKYSPSIIYIKDLERKYLLINPVFEKLFRISKTAIRGRTDHDIFPASVADQFRESDLKVLTEKRAHQVEEPYPHEDGVHTYISHKFPVYDAAGEISGVGGISTDVTALKKAQDRLRRLSGGIMESHEKERAAIARELHDELGQMLTALRMDAVWIADRLTGKPQLTERAVAMRDLIDQSIENVRSTALRLRPGVLDSLGLVDALEWYTADYERRTDITCIFDSGDIPVIKNALATAAYRISQEALTNVARHAQATQVAVQIEIEQGRLVLTVTDDGQGFDTDLLTETQALGVAGMRERAALAGGELTVTSKQGKGTRVHVSIPMIPNPA